MASGRTHNFVNLLLAAGSYAGAKYYGLPDELAWSIAGGVALGFVLNGDLDVDGGSIAFHNVRRLPLVGKLLAFTWRVLWWPYAKIVPHRSPLSHLPILGTLIRVSYLGLLIWPVWPFIPWAALLPWLAPVLLGLALSDLVHWILDMKTLKVFVMWGRAVFWFVALPIALGLLAWWLLVGR